MSTDQPGDQAPARLRQLSSQRQFLTDTSRGNLPHPDTYEMQPLSTVLAAQGFSLAGHEDVWQRSTRPVKSVHTNTGFPQRLTLPARIPATPASALVMPEFSPVEDVDISRQATFPLKIVETPFPPELSPIERIPVTPDQLMIAMPPVQARPIAPPVPIVQPVPAAPPMPVLPDTPQA